MFNEQKRETKLSSMSYESKYMLMKTLEETHQQMRLC